jgi:ribosomal protein S18 acetylase RimI-like enzyme
MNVTASMSLHDSAPGIAIERASLRDASVLARIAAALFEQTFGDANTPADMEAYVTGAFSEARQRQDLADERSRIWLARDTAEDAIVGYAHVRLGAVPSVHTSSARTAEIARLYADRRWHGRGLGAMLMRTCIDAVRNEGVPVLWLGVWEHNERAIAFYEKHGFAIIGDQPFLLGSDRQRDLVMALDLTRSQT